LSTNSTHESSSSVTGSLERRCGPVVLCCMAPEARELLETAISKYAEFRKIDRDSLVGEQPGKPSVYGFAYWLFRYSGLIQYGKTGD
jgi:hypothetical protein